MDDLYHTWQIELPHMVKVVLIVCPIILAPDTFVALRVM